MSPGMMSLNSVGTIYPSHTPDRGQTVEVSGCIVINPGTTTVPTLVEVEKTVIEDLQQI